MSAKTEKMTWPELVEAVSKGDYDSEYELYKRCHDYFQEKSGLMPYLRSDVAEDVFQDSFLVVWTEIQNGKICIKDGKIARVDYTGKVSYMTCSLNTYLMAIIRNKYYKGLRREGPAVLVDLDSSKEIIGESVDCKVSEKELRMQIIDDELEKMSDRCREILTMFYVKGLQLEQILERRSENTSKDGLKTSKSKCLKQLQNNAKRRMSLYE